MSPTCATFTQRTPRSAIGFAQESDAFFRERNPTVTPFGLSDFGRRAVERRSDGHYTIAKRNFVLQIAAVERFGPDHRRGLIRSPVISARAGLHSGERNSFAGRHVGDLFRKFAAARPDLHILGKTVDWNQMRKRPLDP